MYFAFITLLTALALAGVAGWFSIIGIMAILGGSPMHALVAGVTIETAKLVTTSWIYRNWKYASIKLRALLIFFTLIIMLVTSMGVFGFLSKAHIEQGSSTIDNSAKVVRIEEQIAREKSSIDDNQKIIGQLDQVVQVLTDSQRIRGSSGSIAVRRGQAEQRAELRTDIEAAQKRIDDLSQERFTLQSQVREVELKVGPIRYIAELIYGAENSTTQNIEAAVRIFILLLVVSLDPLAVTLLIAANNTFERLRNEKKEKITTSQAPQEERSVPTPTQVETNAFTVAQTINETSQQVPGAEHEHSVVPEERIYAEIPVAAPTEEPVIPDVVEEVSQPLIDEKLAEDQPAPEMPVLVKKEQPTLPVIRSPDVSRVDPTPWTTQSSILDEIIGSRGHFVPKKVIDDVTPDVLKNNTKGKRQNITPPKTLSWLKEFKRT